MKLTLKNTLSFATLAATLLVAQGSASAFTIGIGGTSVAGEGLKTSVAGATSIDFNNGFPTQGIATFSGQSATSLVTGGVSGDHGNPAGDNSKYLTISNVGSGKSGATGSVTINFAKAINYFGLYWGSADNYNNISFYKGTQLLASYWGGDLAKQFSNLISTTGSWTNSQANFYANFSADAGQSFDSVQLKATGVAFESDNYAYTEAQAVPEPMTMTGLALGVGAMVSARRRRTQKA
jgi:hypothetical protein